MIGFKRRLWSGFYGQQPSVTARKPPTDGDDLKSTRKNVPRKGNPKIAFRNIESFKGNLGDDLLEREMFGTLLQTKVVIERQHGSQNEEAI